MTPPAVTTDQLLQTALEHHGAGRLSEARPLYLEILVTHPENCDALHLLGLLAGQSGDLNESVDLIQRAILIDPGQAPFHANLGESFRRMERFDDAISSFCRAIDLNPADAVSLSNLGGALWSRGLFDQAVDACQRAIVLRPDLADAHANLGNALRSRGQIQMAIAACRGAIQLNPRLSEAHHNLANCLLATRAFDDAIGEYLKALELKPDHAMAFFNLANAYRGKGQLDDAIAAYGQALQLAPDFSEAYFNLGITLKDKGQIDKAILAYTTAIHFKPDYAEAHNNLGNALRFKGELDGAVSAFEKAIEAQPAYIEAYNNLGAAYTDQGDLDRAIECFRKAIAIKPEAALVHSNLVYTLHFHGDYGPRKLLEENLAWARVHETPIIRATSRGQDASARISPHPNPSPEYQGRGQGGEGAGAVGQRLKIGYVSPDFRIHSAACFLLPLFSHHDPSRVEIFVYSGVKRGDAMTDRLRAFADHWRDVAAMPDEELADVIGKDGVDVLVDLTLHMAGNRLLAFAHKPAPVQVTWLGYPGTTGLSSIDYRLTDPYLDPPGEGDEFYSEKSVRLPYTFWCYSPLVETPEVNPLPALSTGYVRFGCFNNFAKVTPAAIDLWIEVLRAVPDSRLLIQSYLGSHLLAVRKRFALAGIADERVAFVEKQQPADYFRLFHGIDIVLDPVPYPGHTSSMDALWMGVPVVTLAGTTAASRGGKSILTNVGLAELISDNVEQYVAIAANLASDLDALSSFRSTVRHKMRCSPLCDAARFANDMENTLLELHDNWKKG